MKIGKTEYLEKASALSAEEQQRVLSRMGGKLPNRLMKEKLSVEEAIAIQLEIEDEQLDDWRKNWEKIRKQQAAGNKSKDSEKSRVNEKTKDGGKSGNAAKALASKGQTGSTAGAAPEKAAKAK